MWTVNRFVGSKHFGNTFYLFMIPQDQYLSKLNNLGHVTPNPESVRLTGWNILSNIKRLRDFHIKPFRRRELKHPCERDSRVLTAHFLYVKTGLRKPSLY